MVGIDNMGDELMICTDDLLAMAAVLILGYLLW